ncbi:MAG TPA: glycerophosphodiester phosphodiesterase [Gemmatimonadaceae bacterium]|nr:glycerophosphodiester phosphodiesterase [Gemmatimonadaceae bacterium]
MQRIAHRGAKREFPENTIPAFRRAFERGADAVELDVHATRDGVVVVHHDEVLHAAAGLPSARIADLTWAELRTVQLAPAIGVPTLTDVIAAAPASSTLYVEIKGAEIESLVAPILSRAAVACAVHSFDHEAIARIRGIAPGIPRGILFERTVPDLESVLARTGARDVWPHWSLIDAPLLSRAHELGARVIAWTVNDRAVAASLAAMGVDGLCGDDVRLFDDLGA